MVNNIFVCKKRASRFHAHYMDCPCKFVIYLQWISDKAEECGRLMPMYLFFNSRYANMRQLVPGRRRLRRNTFAG
jgi:hypothetical protein